MRALPSYYRASLAGCLILFTVTAPALLAQQEKELGDVRERAFRAEYDGSVQKYVIMMRRGWQPDEPVSLLVALHGHGSDRWQFVRQPRGECRAARDVAAAHGMALIAPDYRESTSWMGPAAEADVLQIIRSLKKQFTVKNVVLCGGSMGGTGALTFTALHPELIDGVVSFNGTANLVEYTRFQDAIAKSYGGSKQEVPGEYKKRSAEFVPQKFTMPFAATTGGQDKTVPPESVLRLITAIEKHNPNVLSIHQPAGGHSTTYEDSRRALEYVITASQKEQE